MKKHVFSNRRPFLFILLLFFISFNSVGQSVKRQVISSYGGSISDETITISQSAGQAYQTNASYEESTSVLPGFQQPVIFKVEEIDDDMEKQINMKVYPNPADYSVTIEIEEFIENSHIYVKDISGRLIYSHKVSEMQVFELNCTAWANGIYVISVSDISNNLKASVKLIIQK
jgi:hypothetical protein